MKVPYEAGEPRKIIHVDMDCFYAAIEQRDNPKLKGKPVVVGGRPDSRGVVCTASYEARRYGIRSAMPCKKAYQLCRHAVFVKPNFAAYKAASKQIREIFREVTDLIEPLSLDEAYLDVTENKLGEPSATRIAQYIRARIKEVTKVTASAGVAPVKFVAKIASDLNKPDGLYVVPPEKLQKFVLSLRVEQISGVGPATTKRLNSRGIFTAADVQKWKVEDLERALGKHGRFLHRLSYGIDPRPVCTSRNAKSRGSEETFSKDIKDPEILVEVVDRQCREVLESLEKMKRLAKTVTVKVRFKGFHTVTRSHTLRSATTNVWAVQEEARKLLLHALKNSEPVRLIGVSLSGFEFEEEPWRQLEFKFQ